MRAYFLLLAIFAFSFLGMSQKPKLAIRFHSETNSRDTDTFAIPVHLNNANRDTHLGRVPDFSERQISAILPFKSADGSWGCVFQLDKVGRMRLETVSSESRGAALVIFVSTKQGLHQVTDMVIDRPVSDGVITVPSGLSDLEIAVMRTQFRTIGEAPKKKAKKVKESPDSDWHINRERGEAAQQRPADGAPAVKAAPQTR